MISTFTVILDANVLYKVRLISLLMSLAVKKMFRARWTDDIHEEWMRNLIANRPDISSEQVSKRRADMNLAVPDALVTGHEAITIDGLPDPDDGHVIAAAVLTRASMIVTFNLKDFPARILTPLRLEARHPDDFLIDQYTLAPELFTQAVRQDKRRYRNPPLSTAEYLNALERAGVPETAAQLREIAVLLD